MIGEIVAYVLKNQDNKKAHKMCAFLLVLIFMFGAPKEIQTLVHLVRSHAAKFNITYINIRLVNANWGIVWMLTIFLCVLFS